MLVTVAQAGSFLRLGTNLAQEVSDLLQKLIDGAESFVSSFCGVAFSTSPQVETFPLIEGRFAFYWPNLLPIVSVTKITDLFLSRDLDVSEFAIMNIKKIAYKSGGRFVSWPSDEMRFEITYVGGYNNGDGSPPPGSIPAPEAMSLAVLLLVKKAYESPGIKSQGFQGVSLNFESLADNCEIKALLQPHQFHPLAF